MIGKEDPSSGSPIPHQDLCADADCTAVDVTELLSRVSGVPGLVREHAATAADYRDCQTALEALFEDAWRAVLVDELPSIRRRMDEVEKAVKAAPEYAECHDDPALPELPQCTSLRYYMLRRSLELAAKAEMARVRRGVLARIEPLGSRVESMPACAALASVTRVDLPGNAGRCLGSSAVSATMRIVQDELHEAGGAGDRFLLLVDLVSGEPLGSAGGAPDFACRSSQDSTRTDYLAAFGCSVDRERLAGTLATGSVVQAVVVSRYFGDGCLDHGVPYWDVEHRLAAVVAGADDSPAAVLVLRGVIRAPRAARSPIPLGWWVGDWEAQPMLLEREGQDLVADPTALHNAIRIGAAVRSGVPAGAAISADSHLVRLAAGGEPRWAWLEIAQVPSDGPVAIGERLRCGTLSFLALVDPPP
ncbi:MAG: hypothetical protein HY905_10210 [Deltaproteobacteria bacterium]|nr:hypothetical protein [Deltaproteobacteria bacterium]